MNLCITKRFVDYGNLRKNYNKKLRQKQCIQDYQKRGIAASRIRVPGGYLKAEILGMIQEIAEKYGNGVVRLTTRQGFEIKRIRLEDMDAINEMLQPMIELLDINQQEPDAGHPASSTRNITTCIGNNVCPFANYNTAEFAKRIERRSFRTTCSFVKQYIDPNAPGGKEHIGYIIDRVGFEEYKKY